MTSPTERCLDVLRRAAWQPTVVEKWHAPRGAQMHGTRSDMYGLADVYALSEFTLDRRPLFVQACGHDVAGHARKAEGVTARGSTKLMLPKLLRAGSRFEIWGWTTNKADEVVCRRHVARMGQAGVEWLDRLPPSVVVCRSPEAIPAGLDCLDHGGASRRFEGSLLIGLCRTCAEARGMDLGKTGLVALVSGGLA